MPGRISGYDRAMLKIKEQLLLLSELVGKQLDLAMKSFIEQDEVLARSVICADEEVDIGDTQLELHSLELISIQQPVVQDLRFLAAAMRISRELERISDYACDIAETTLRLRAKEEWFKPLIDLPQMVLAVQHMLAKSILAYKEQNLSLAGQLDDDDREVDGFYHDLYEELILYMKQNPDSVEQAFSILLITRYLERIADHVVNIAEMVIFAATGDRHPFKRKVEPAG